MEFFNPFYYEWGRVGLTNLVFKAHLYGVEFKGFQGKRLEPREFEWVLKDEPKTEVTGQKGIEAVSRRLKQLGY